MIKTERYAVILSSDLTGTKDLRLTGGKRELQILRSAQSARVAQNDIVHLLR